MPYVDEGTRELLQHEYAEEPGELNYLITTIIKDYMDNNKLSYQTINDIVGALESAKLEFYRRVVVPYEEKKRETNGDVY